VTLSPGDKLGPYEILSPIGEGGMGEVYKARDTRLDRFVAIKVSKTAFDQRFENEARAVASLNHPNICTLFDVGPNYLVMEFVEGEELRGPLPVAKAIDLACKILDGLDAAHRKGITHRDLKPANVMVTKSDLKVMDFGLAKIAPAASKDSDTTRTVLTGDASIVGTLYYMAPEQLQGKADVDTRADIFAFGCVLYEILTGKRAFQGANPASIIAGILERPAPSIAAVAPAALDRVLRRCLEKDRDDRWQSVRDLKIELLWAMEEIAPLAPKRAKSWFGYGAAAVLALALGGALWYIATRPAPPEARLDIVTPPSTSPGDFALSPDGQQIAYVAANGNASQIWVRPLASASGQPLAGTEDAQFPFWSPDSRSLGFFASGKLKRVDLGASAPQALADAQAARGGTWNAEGTILFCPYGPDGLFRMPAAGGQATPVTHLDMGQSSHRHPRFLPDGKHFLFYVMGRGSGIYLGNLEMNGAAPRLLSAADSAGEYLTFRRTGGGVSGWITFVQQNTLIARSFDVERGQLFGDPMTLAQSVRVDRFRAGAFSVSRSGLIAWRTGAGGSRQLLWFNRAGEPAGTLGSPDSSGLNFPQISPDRQRVAVTSGPIGSRDIWLADTANSIRFTFDTSDDIFPIWSPDGRRVLFGSNRGGPFDLYVKAADGSGPEQLVLASVDGKLPNSWSPDGRFLLYRSTLNRDDLMVLPVLPEGNGKPYPFLTTPFSEQFGMFSPDGKWVAYQSNESGRFEIYVRPFPGPGGVWQISTRGGAFPRWRADGKELNYLAPDNQLMAVAISAQSASITPGQPVALFTANFARSINLPPYDVARDGRFLVNLELNDAATPPITLLQNWQAPK